MKKRFINKAFTLLIVLSAVLVTQAYAIEQNMGYVESNFNYIHVSTFKYEPYPVTPGRYFDLWLRIENTGQEKIDAEFNLTPLYPFSLDENEKPGRKIGDLNGMETTLLHYKVRADVNAVEGSNPLHFKILSNGALSTANINIWVQAIDANVGINSISSKSMTPGQASPVEINLENFGDSSLTDINVKMDLTASDNPFVPINSTSEKKTSVIEPRSKETITFQMMPLPNSKAGTYKIPITISYVDGTGKNYSKSSIIALTVGATPDIGVTIPDSKVFAKGEIGDIGIKVTNKGLTNIKFVNVYLNNTKNYDVLSENSVYVGNIDSDDYSTADYRIKLNKVSDGKAPMVLVLEYLDANNNKYNEEMVVYLKVVSAKDKGVDGNGNGSGTIIFAIIIIAAGYYFYKRWEKKKLHPNKK